MFNHMVKKSKLLKWIKPGLKHSCFVRQFAERKRDEEGSEEGGMRSTVRSHEEQKHLYMRIFSTAQQMTGPFLFPKSQTNDPKSTYVLHL